jgi:hypothetical protein
MFGCISINKRRLGNWKSVHFKIDTNPMCKWMDEWSIDVSAMTLDSPVRRLLMAVDDYHGWGAESTGLTDSSSVIILGFTRC